MRDLPPGVPIVNSGARPGLSEPAPAAAGRQVRARKRAHPVQVRFADRRCTVDTLEGPVPAQPGDAIVTGLLGELWPVARGAFAGKYQAVPPLQMGAPGTYLSLPIDVVAVPMHAAFEVTLADGHSRLSGQAGDWLVDYGDGSLGIVNAAIFAATYDVLEST